MKNLALILVVLIASFVFSNLVWAKDDHHPDRLGQIINTASSSQGPTDTPTSTPTDTPIRTPRPTSTPTDTPTSTPVPMDTPTATPSPSPTSTPTPAPSETPRPALASIGDIFHSGPPADPTSSGGTNSVSPGLNFFGPEPGSAYAVSGPGRTWYLFGLALGCLGLSFVFYGRSKRI